MPFDLLCGKSALDWVLGGGAPAAFTGRWISLATASPTQTNAFDGPFTPRGTVTFAAANSPQMSVTNLNVISATLTAIHFTAVGWNLWDNSVGGNRIAYGTLANLGSVSSVGSIVHLVAGALKITLT